MQHLDEGTIHAWLDGALSADESARAERHAADCAQCAERVADARGLIAGASRIVSSLDHVRGGVLPATRAAAHRASAWRRLHLTPVRAALAATLLLAVGSLLAVRYADTGKPVQVLQNANKAAVSPPNPPAAVTLPGAKPATIARRTPKAPPTHVATKPKHAVSSRDSVASVATSARPIRNAAPAIANVAAAEVRAASPPSVLADSFVAKVASTADSVVRARRRAFGAGTLRLQEVVVTGADASQGFEGCYAIRTDAAGDGPALPARFALERPNVVRNVTPDAHRDTVIRGASWRQSGATAATVSFPQNSGDGTITLRFTAQGLASHFASASQPPRVFVVRSDCKP